jgi:hypothetical protein
MNSGGGGCGLVSSGTGRGTLVSCCVHDKSRSFVKLEQFFD